MSDGGTITAIDRNARTCTLRVDPDELGGGDLLPDVPYLAEPYLYGPALLKDGPDDKPLCFGPLGDARLRLDDHFTRVAAAQGYGDSGTWEILQSSGGTPGTVAPAAVSGGHGVARLTAPISGGALHHLFLRTAIAGFTEDTSLLISARMRAVDGFSVASPILGVANGIYSGAGATLPGMSAVSYDGTDIVVYTFTGGIIPTFQPTQATLPAEGVGTGDWAWYDFVYAPSQEFVSGHLNGAGPVVPDTRSNFATSSVFGFAADLFILVGVAGNGLVQGRIDVDCVHVRTIDPLTGPRELGLTT